MPVSDEHQFLYIHIPKCAGTSIGANLSQLTSLSFYKPGDVDKIKPEFWELAKLTGKLHRKEKHLSANELKNMIGETKFKKYFKFTFVRHPANRLISFYNFARNHKNPEVKKKHVRLAISSENVNNFIYEISLDKNFDLFFNQWQYIYDFEGKNCLVDYIGKTETVDKNFNDVCKKIGLKQSFKNRLMNFFSKDLLPVPFLNVSKNKRSEFYRDLTDESKELLRTRCKKDCDLFDYQID
jgi:hypothetical protein